jgi:hypothetical protein
LESAPRTVEGFAVMRAIERLGVWYRAGMNGVIVGLRIEEAMASLPDDDCDRGFARRLFAVAEAAFCTAACERETSPEEREQA